MKENISHIRSHFKVALHRTQNVNDLDELEITYLGRKGEVNALFSKLPSLTSQEKKILGPLLNELKEEIKNEIEKKRRSYADAFSLDASLPGIRPQIGTIHPTTYAIEEIAQIFSSLGFRRHRFPEIESEYYAFEALNMPHDHPARDEWETFFVQGETQKGKTVLTPHTSSSQVRHMEKGALPIRLVNISKCYRRQSDISHVPMFYQFEGLVIDEGINLTHLVGILEYFVHSFFGPDTKVRLRPYHFQFTEPSFEVDISCGFCQGKGCRYCKQGWSELGGAGLVHPRVLEFGKVDSKMYSGLAFGWGVERTYLMRNATTVGDIREIYKNKMGSKWE